MTSSPDTIRPSFLRAVLESGKADEHLLDLLSSADDAARETPAYKIIGRQLQKLMEEGQRIKTSAPTEKPNVVDKAMKVNTALISFMHHCYRQPVPEHTADLNRYAKLSEALVKAAYMRGRLSTPNTKKIYPAPAGTSI